jgi:hypothetical protein
VRKKCLRYHINIPILYKFKSLKKITKYSYFILLNIIVILFNFNFYNSVNGNPKFDDFKKEIEICCTWGETLKDGILTFKIVNAKPVIKQIVKDALYDWEQKIKELRFEEADYKGKADITISFGSDNGKVAGQTITNFDSNGFIYSNKIFLAENAFTKKLTTDLIEYIAKHEIGHALGLGHANFDESLMSSLVYTINNKIDTCEIEALNEANKWKLIDESPFPKISKIKYYVCK